MNHAAGKHVMCGLPSTTQAEVISPINNNNKQMILYVVLHHLKNI